jgi:hypothetical protein
MRYMMFAIIVLSACETGLSDIQDAATEAGSTDAQASLLVEADCDKESVDVTAWSNGLTMVSYSYYADVAVPGVVAADAPHIQTVICGYQCAGASCAISCPPDATCTHSGYTRPQYQCIEQNAQIEDDRAIVFCGNKIIVDYVFGDQNDFLAGVFFTKAYVRYSVQ